VSITRLAERDTWGYSPCQAGGLCPMVAAHAWWNEPWSSEGKFGALEAWKYWRRTQSRRGLEKLLPRTLQSLNWHQVRFWQSARHPG